MPNVMVFGRYLPDVRYEYLEELGVNALFINEEFAAHFPLDESPLQAYCKWLSHGRIINAEVHALRELRSYCQNY